MATIHHEAVAETDRPLISWGAIFAGLVFIVAASWLLFLLGSAIGLSIADVSNVGQGLGIGAVAWLLLTALLVYFLGSWLTARLAGKPERSAGILHGITLWSLATVLMLVLGMWGVRGLFQAGSAVVSTTATAAAKMGAAGAQAGDGQGGGVLAESPLMTSIQARMKQEIAKALAEAQQPDGPSEPPGGESEPGGQSQPAGSPGERESGPSELAASASEPAATQEEIQQALSEIDASTLVAATQPIIAGEPEQAKDVLAVNTSLSEREIDAVVDSVMREMSQQINEAQTQMSRTMEQVSTYTQAVTWVAFAAGALALLVAIAGGWLGAGRVHRLHVHDVTRESAAT